MNLRIEINIIQEGKRVGMKHNIPLKGALFYHVCVYSMPLSLAGKKEADILYSAYIIIGFPSLGRQTKLKFWFSSLAGIRESRKCSGQKNLLPVYLTEYLLSLQWPF